MSKHDDLVARAKELNIAGVSPRWSDETLRDKIADAEGAGNRTMPLGGNPIVGEALDIPVEFRPLGAGIPGSTTPRVPDDGHGFSTAEAAIGLKSDQDMKFEEQDRKRLEERADLAGFDKLRELDKSGAWAGAVGPDREPIEERSDPAGFRHLRALDKATGAAGAVASNPAEGIYNQPGSPESMESLAKASTTPTASAKAAAKAEPTGVGSTLTGPSRSVE